MRLEKELELTSHALLRVATLPLCEDITSDKNVRRLLDQDDLRESIFLASASLFKNLFSKQGKKRAELVLYKYLQRMKYRCIPFGKFVQVGGVAMVEAPRTRAFNLNEGVGLAVAELDFAIYYDLFRKLATDRATFDLFKFYPNNSIYQKNDELRYVESNINQFKISYDLSRVANSDILNALLAQCTHGKSVNELIDMLVQKGYSPADSEKFVLDLIEADLLMSDASPNILAENYVEFLAELLQQKPIFQDQVKVLAQIADCLKNGNLEKYADIISLLSDLDITFDQNKVFHVVSYQRWSSNFQLSSTTKQNLLEATSFLSQLNKPNKIPRLELFLRRFRQKFEHKFVPILEAFDPEYGIPYDTQTESHFATKEIGKLNIFRPQSSSSKVTRLDQIEALLLQQLVNCSIQGKEEIELSELCKNLPQEDDLSLSDSYSLMLSLYTKEGADLVHLQGCYGPTALKLISRFSNDQGVLEKLCLDIFAHEEKLNEKRIIGDITHIADLRSANIISRVKFPGHEIPIHTPATGDEQLPLSDLHLGIHAGKLKIISKSLQKEVVPRLSNAHNYSNKTLPIYKFLGDYAYFNKNHVFHFDWGSLYELFRVFPRVTYKNVIVSPRKWKIGIPALAQLKKLDPIEKTNRCAWVDQHNLPNTFFYVDGDYKLFVNKANPSSFQALQDTIKQLEEPIILEEVIHTQTPFSDGGKQSYANEIIWPLVKKHPEKSNAPNFQHTFAQKDDSWLYLKLYCGIDQFEKRVMGRIGNGIAQLKELELIAKWFLIRYADPHFHVRLRVLPTHGADKFKVASVLLAALDDLKQKSIISSIVVDSYLPEYDRYHGKQTMGYCEHLFNNESTLLANLIRDDYSRFDENRMFTIMLLVDRFLDEFGIDLVAKSDFVGFLSKQFFAEFSLQKGERVELDKYYREIRPKWHSFSAQISKHQYAYPHILRKEEANQQYINSILAHPALAQDENKFDLLSSLVHMLINRFSYSRPRENETLIYYFLHKHYTSALARLKYNG